MAARAERLPSLVGHPVLVPALLVLALAGWAITSSRMDGMDMGPGSDLGSLGFYVTAWVVMMAAMMFPSVAPMVVVHARIQARRREGDRSVTAGTTALFLAGYLLAWTSFGLAAYGLFALADWISLDFLAWDRGGRWVAAGVVVAAAGYQLTPLKDACLTRCRGPLAFFLESWREGRLGSLRMGAVHGAWCVGCCWALMAALFAVGVMSVTWMVVIAGLIAVEKLLPWRSVANRGIAVFLLALGIAVAAAPGSVPGLTVPDGAHGMEHDGMKAPGGMEREGMKAPGGMEEMR
jgi:predicted metal-binding membrane protein